MERFYRNRVAVISLEGAEIEAGYLWKWQGEDLLVLEDDDQYVSCKLDTEVFEEIEI